MDINFIDLKRQYQAYKDEIDASMQEVISSAGFIMGKPVVALENALAEFAGVEHALSCSSGTDALLLALMTYDIQPGDEIITTPFSFFASSEVIALLKAKPVFVDINPDTYNIDHTKISAAITEHTRGIIAVDIFGQCADYNEINAIAKEHNLFVIEDAAQSFGAEYNGRKAGSLADIACTSFFPAKPLGCFGDGGMVFTNNPDKAELMESLRVHGQGKNRYDNVRIGLNARLDTLQAAILLTKFKHFPEEIRLRNKFADYYTENLKTCAATPKILPHNLSVFAQYSIRVSQRDALQEHLHGNKIPTAIHYQKPLHRQDAFNNLGYDEGSFPTAEQTTQDIIALPMHPFLLEEEQDYIIEHIKSFYT